MTSEACFRDQERQREHHPAASASTGSDCCLPRPDGLGGGIERYVQTVQSAFDDVGVACLRLDLTGPGPAGHRALLAAGGSGAAGGRGGTAGTARLIVAHRALLPVAAVLARIRRVSGISVICHGSRRVGFQVGPALATRELADAPP